MLDNFVCGGSDGNSGSEYTVAPHMTVAGLLVNAELYLCKSSPSAILRVA